MLMDTVKRMLNTLLKKEIVIVLVVLLVVYVLITYNDSKVVARDNMEGGIVSGDSLSPAPVDVSPVLEEKTVADIVNYKSSPSNVPGDLLPVDHNSEWAKLNPTSNLNGSPDLLQPGYHIGTVSQVLRNANLQIRADPVIPRVDNISPWGMSTIEPDLGRVPLEVGYGPR
jgi:hypothetical protein